MRETNWNAIGYASMPQPPDTTREDARDDAISARFDEIWDDADLLHCALEDAGIPFSLQTCTRLRDRARWLWLNPHAPRSEADLFIVGLVEDMQEAVLAAATHEINNPDWEP